MPSSTHSKRLDGYAHRLMCLLALNEQKDAIDIDTANDVIDLIDWEFKVRQMYDPIDADNSTAKMEQNIQRQLTSRGIMTRRELKQYCHANRSGMWCFNKAMENLQREKEIERNKDNTWKVREE